MRISNISRFALAAVLCHNGPLAADQVTLAPGDAQLTGEVLSLDEAGVLELGTVLSPQPLRLRKNAISRVEFNARGPVPGPPNSMIQLANGDRLPVEIESLDDRVLKVRSPEAGRLEVPRGALTWLQLGVRDHKRIYSGPNSLEEWSGGVDEPRNLSFERGRLIAGGPATASRKLELPRDFILRFTLAWEARQTPNFQVSFADPLLPKGEPADRYYLQFNGAGLEIKRESSRGARYKTILLLNRTPNQFPERELRVEIRVKRSTSRVQLFLNGEPEGRFPDPVEGAPQGSGIAIVCNATQGNPQEIRDIEVFELDDSRGRHGSEERGDPKTDSLISREDDRWGGRLLDIRPAANGQVFRFKSDFQEDPLEIPAADVSTVFFAETAAPEDKQDPPKGFLLRLNGGGSLNVGSCRFTGDRVAANHPLLGNLDLDRSGIISLEPSAADQPPKKKP